MTDSLWLPRAMAAIPRDSDTAAARQMARDDAAPSHAGRHGVEPFPYIQTHAGRAFPLLSPTAEDVHLDDVAYALAHINRYTGHGGAYTVAQHSVHVSAVVRSWGGDLVEQFAGLVHDATEAYVGDVASPLKRLLPSFKRIERGVWLAVAERWCLLPTLPEIVKRADLAMLMTEARDLLGPSPLPHGWPDVEPIDADVLRIIPWSPGEAHDRFLARFHSLASALEVAA